ncbi:1,2-phenylacetyl-CoA epoxidase subunit PaaE [Aureispira anguillae]|uniref:Phenylacetate-CoA oxygenase/reductase subunit PaaK n=1 Tax=Aureispira anguillae TaxID=2864201 RepID=A0A915YER9_9BACT|nr:1,2-phenylacetyl-CoA epoxidase subunit PaaE [Aureispira anguillae]BDS11704.1 phenylacetate-CoA oxygenase/reductase subunit PaaK [Aureispira anguillae]
MKPTFNTLKIKEVRKETVDCCSIAFEVPEALKTAYSFVQGQYLTLKADINNEDVRRSYSICTSPADEELRVAIKQVENGKFSTFANHQLQAGDSLEVMTPTGNFYTVLDASNEKHYVGFAAGSGITPIISIMKTVLETEPKSRFTLFYGNKNTGSIIFREQIEALKNIYMERLIVHYFLSREMLDAPLMNGRIDASKCTDIFDKLLDVSDVDECFACGPESMIFAVKDTLIDRGYDEKHIHFELFTSPLGKLGQEKKIEVKEADKGKITEVTVNLDGKAFQFDLPFGSENLLDAALKQGADLPFACKGGVCCTCKAKLKEGAVKMALNYALEKEEVEAGFILTCQSYPTTEKVVVDFDEV